MCLTSDVVSPVFACIMTLTTRGKALGTFISTEHIKGISPIPNSLAATAGNSDTRSGVLVKMTEIKSETARLFFCIIC